MGVTPALDRTGLTVELDGLSVTYTSRDGTKVQAMEPVSVRLQPGEFVAIVGQSGCGKSTILRVLAGLIPHYDGAASIDGAPITQPRPDVGVMFQRPVLLPWRTALSNVILPARINGRSKADAQEEGRRLLAMTGLTGFENKYPWELSGGMQQRVALSRSLLGNPRLLLMDEPFGALDEFTRERLNLELLRIWSDLKPTVVLVTHSIDEAVLLADRVIMMAGQPGRLVGVEPITLPRPRRLDMVGSVEFTKHVSAIRDGLGVNR